MSRRTNGRWTPLWLGLLLATSGQTVAGREGRDQQVHITHPAARRAVVSGVLGAAARLRQPECLQILADFPAWPGREVVRELEMAGVTLADYVFTRVWFVDGSDSSGCRAARAFTGVRHKVVRVCPSRIITRSPRAVELLVIHEILHTLGLPENPPSSAEITTQVRRRCG